MTRLSNDEREEIWDSIDDAIWTAVKHNVNPTFDESLAKYLGVLPEYTLWFHAPRNHSADLPLKVFYRLA